MTAVEAVDSGVASEVVSKCSSLLKCVSTIMNTQLLLKTVTKREESNASRRHLGGLLKDTVRHVHQ